MPSHDHIKSEIKSKLDLRIPIKTILNEIREKFNDRNNRDDLTDMRHTLSLHRQKKYSKHETQDT